MLAMLILTVATAAPTVQQDTKKDPPPRLELFAKEDWYQKQEAKQQEFVGVLKKVEMPKGVGFNRFNPYKLTTIVYVKVAVQIEVGGKLVTEYREVAEQHEREVYVGGKNDILDAYVGKTVKLVGKPVMMEVEGKKHNEIWPARLELVPPPVKGPAPAQEEECCEGDDAKELKIHAKARWQYVMANPDGDTKGKQFALHSAAELVAATPFKNLDAPQQVVEKKATEELAKALKVESIDWSKQMLVVVTGGVKPTGGWQIDVQKVVVDGKKCVVVWQLTPPDGFATQAFTHPSLVALVDRCEGTVEFAVAPPSKKIKPPAKEPR
jgi:hypothetical protein